MQTKLAQGDRLPYIRLNMTGGSIIDLPGDMPTRYLVLLYFRGAW